MLLTREALDIVCSGLALFAPHDAEKNVRQPLLVEFLPKRFQRPFGHEPPAVNQSDPIVLPNARS